MRVPAWLTLVRHGESTGNAARDRALAAGAEVVTGVPEREADVPLSPLGRDQARDVGSWLAGQEPVDAVYSSPYLRALDTARIATGRPGIVVDERLRDRETGVFHRLTPAGAQARYPEEVARQKEDGKFYYRPPGGESWPDVLLRVRSFLRDLPDGRVLVFAHDAVIVLIRAALEGLDEAAILAVEAELVANCSVSTWEHGRRIRYNDRSHLTLQRRET